jgi:hypothetical protein
MTCRSTIGNNRAKPSSTAALLGVFLSCARLDVLVSDLSHPAMNDPSVLPGARGDPVYHRMFEVRRFLITLPTMPAWLLADCEK